MDKAEKGAREKPIPFGAPMVRATLAGSKTQTRRVLGMPSLTFDAVFNDDGTWHVGDALTGHRYAKLPVRYRSGDRLYVREAWRTHNSWDAMPPRDVITAAPVWYEADGQAPAERDFGRYRHARFMPRWASRITLTVTDVRVQRLQDICEEDAVAEGINRLPGGNGDQWADYPLGTSAAGWTNPRDSYRSLWTEINGPGSWEKNPRVAAYTFSVEKAP